MKQSRQKPCSICGKEVRSRGYYGHLLFGKEDFSRIMKWKRFVGVGLFDNGGAPFYVQWAVWCWRKPIWIGLPLMVVMPFLLVVDLIYLIAYGLVEWAKHKL